MRPPWAGSSATGPSRPPRRTRAREATARSPAASANRRTSALLPASERRIASVGLLVLPEAGRCRAVPVQRGEMLELATTHANGFAGCRMIVAEHVQHAVNDQQGQFVVERAGVGGCVGG